MTDIIITNQMYIFSISNSIGMELWNSYSNWYPNSVQIVANYHLIMSLTNDDGWSMPHQSIRTFGSTLITNYY